MSAAVDVVLKRPSEDEGGGWRMEVEDGGGGASRERDFAVVRRKFE
jgi:hypothetical protein